jgi:proteic killer suppression protein
MTLVTNTVTVAARAKKQLRKLPVHIVAAFRHWVRLVEANGLEEVRKIAGYHDEPLKGERVGQRSVRLNRAYRAIYVVTVAGVSVEVVEVNKHDY